MNEFDRQTTRRSKWVWGVTCSAVILASVGYGCWPSPSLGQTAAPSTQQVQIILPIDLIELIKALFYGVALVCTPLATVYSIVSANRAKRAEQQSKQNSQNIGRVVDNVALIERNTNSMTSEIARLSREKGEVEGERIGVLAGEKKARELAEGQRQGRDDRRSDIGHHLPLHVPHRPVVEQPLPVADARTADAAERSAAATERVADAAEETAKKS